MPAGMTSTTAAVAALILCCMATASPAERAPLNDPTLLNIGFSCRWETRCMSVQRKAMKRGLAFVRKSQPPAWKVHLCNRNAGRGYQRVDWVGFDHCIRNTSLRPPAPPVRHRRHVRSRR